MASKSVYSTDHAESVLSTHRWRTIANSAQFIKPYLKPGIKVLDVGCGPGSLTVDIAKHIQPGGQVTGIENVPDPLDGARQLAQEDGVEVTFEVADAMNLPYEDDSFDLVFAHQVLQHVSQPVEMLKEMRRVAKKGSGVVACRESAIPTWYPPRSGLSKAHDLMLRMGRGRGSNPHPGNHIHTWAHSAGFPRNAITCSTGSWCFSSPEERAYWGGSFAARTESSGFAKMAVEGGYATKEDLGEMAEAWREFVRDDEGWYAILHGEIVCRKERWGSAPRGLDV